MQSPASALNFNRYSYCLNNPLKYTDPDGENPLIVIGISALLGGTMNVVNNWQNIHGFWNGMAYFGVGAAAGAASSAAGIYIPMGGGFIGGTLTGSLCGIVYGGILEAGNAWIQGGDIWRSALNGAGINGLYGAITGGIFGAAEAIYNGSNFWTGEPIVHEPIKSSPSNANAIPENSKTGASFDSGSTSQLSPYEKGQLGVNRAISEFEAEGGIVYQREVSLKVDGVTYRADFVGEKDGMLHIVEVKNGPNARLTPNQKIVIPKLQYEQPAFIPFGRNALKIDRFSNFVPYKMPYTGDYMFNFIHYQ